MRIVELTQESKKNLLADLLKRSTNDYGNYEEIVAGIVADVVKNKEDALFAYTEKFDKCTITRETFRVTDEEIKAKPIWEIMRLAKECGCKFTFGSDCHHPKEQKSILTAKLICDHINLTEDDILIL